METLIVGDCIEKLKEWKDTRKERFRCIVTSPPYNLDINYDIYEDKKTLDEYLAWTKEWAKAVYDVAKEDAIFFMNIGERLKNIFFSHDVARAVTEVGWKVKNRIIWLRRNATYLSSGTNLTPMNEFIFAFTKSPEINFENIYALGVLPFDKDYDRRKTKNRKQIDGIYVRDRGNFWVFKPEDNHISYLVTNIFESTVVGKNQFQKQEWFKHPASFPLELPAACISISTKEEEWVLDPFCGTATTMMASKLLNRHSVGIDLSENYINDGVNRINTSDETLLEFFPKVLKKDKIRSLI